MCSHGELQILAAGLSRAHAAVELRNEEGQRSEICAFYRWKPSETLSDSELYNRSVNERATVVSSKKSSVRVYSQPRQSVTANLPHAWICVLERLGP